MKLRRELPQREIELGGEHEHGQAGLQAEPAVYEPHADGNRNQGDAQGRGELEHRAREKGDPQGPHRRLPVMLTDPREHGGVLRPAVERPQRRQATHDIQEVTREQPEREPSLTRAILGVPADQPHEDGDERQREQHQAGGQGIDRHDQAEHRQRHQDRKHDLGQVAGEIRLEPVHTLDRRRGDLACLGAVERDRLVAKPRLDERKTKVGEDRRSRAAPGYFEDPRQHAPPRESQRQQEKVERDVAQRRAGEGLGDDLRDQCRLKQNDHGRGRADDRVQHEQMAHRPCAPHETFVEDPQDQLEGDPLDGRASASVGGRTSSPVTRARKT